MLAYGKVFIRKNGEEKSMERDREKEARNSRALIISYEFCHIEIALIPVAVRSAEKVICKGKK